MGVIYQYENLAFTSQKTWQTLYPLLIDVFVIIILAW